MPPDDYKDEQEIIEKVNFLTNVLVPSIRAIDSAIENDKSSINVAKNLISNLLPEWKVEIGKELNEEELIYEKRCNEISPGLKRGTTGEQKQTALRKLMNTEHDYSRNVKAIIINLLHKKVGLFQTRRKVEQGYYSLRDIAPEELDD